MTFVCRSCSGTLLAPVIDLGRTPLANALLEPGFSGEEPRYPLQVVFCENCTLVQITETVPPEVLFSNYVYFSSFSDTAVASAKSIADRLMLQRRLSPDSLVMEAASNDGYLLQHYRARGVPVLGIEPAANIAKMAEQNGIRTRCAFFGREEALKLASSGMYCDVFHANNVLAHVADLNGFVEGIRSVLKPDGVASIEVPYLGDLIEKYEFDTVYHEHLCYFSATALDRLASRHQLMFADVERIPIHGGSLRVFLTHAGGQRTIRLAELLENEKLIGLTEAAAYSEFSAQVSTLGKKLAVLLQDLKAKGHKIAAYGASAKGSTLLNFFNIGKDLIDFVADRSTVKQGKLTPGTHLPIVAPDALLDQKPDYVLLLTWNFAAEILEQQQAYRKAGGKFIIPIPDVRVV